MALTIGFTGFAQAANPNEITYEIALGVYSFDPDKHYHLMFVVSADGVAVFETVNSEHAGAMLKAISAVTDQPIKYALNGHNHWDHSSGGRVPQKISAETVMYSLAAEWRRRTRVETRLHLISFGMVHPTISNLVTSPFEGTTWV